MLELHQNLGSGSGFARLFSPKHYEYHRCGAEADLVLAGLEPKFCTSSIENEITHIVHFEVGLRIWIRLDPYHLADPQKSRIRH